MSPLRKRPYNGPKMEVERDLCGGLPSGEVCCLEPDHEGKHERLKFMRVFTDYQEPEED